MGLGPEPKGSAEPFDRARDELEDAPGHRPTVGCPPGLGPTGQRRQGGVDGLAVELSSMVRGYSFCGVWVHGMFPVE